jgi:dTDP-glucose pyrophosphorylase
VANADQWIDGPIDSFIAAARASLWDGAIMTFPNTHPRWSYARVEDGLVVAVAEKQPISRHATAGLYYFQRGIDFVRGAERMLFKNASFGGEFYVAPVYNELILDGKRVGVFPIEAAQMHGLGTPEEVERFQARLYALAS